MLKNNHRPVYKDEINNILHKDMTTFFTKTERIELEYTNMVSGKKRIKASQVPSNPPARLLQAPM